MCSKLVMLCSDYIYCLFNCKEIFLYNAKKKSVSKFSFDMIIYLHIHEHYSSYDIIKKDAIKHTANGSA